jgi:hypothetical protein
VLGLALALAAPLPPVATISAAICSEAPAATRGRITEEQSG